MNSVILAGGMGSRLKPITDHVPKPAIHVGNKPCIRYVLEWLTEVGFDNILVKLHYKPELVIKAMGDEFPIRTFIEQTLTPTAQFLKSKANLLDDEFLVTNGDTITNLNLKDFIDFHLERKNLCTVFTHHDPVHSGGAYIFDKEVLRFIKNGWDIPDLIQFLIDDDIPINVYRSDAYYFDIGTMEKLEKARKYFATRNLILK